MMVKLLGLGVNRNNNTENLEFQASVAQMVELLICNQ